MTGHIVNQVQNHQLRSDNTLHVIGVVSNPVRYHSRYRLARQWQEAMEATPNVKTYTVEAAFGDRHHEVTEQKDGHLQLRTKSEIWIKENMINLGVRHLLPRDWKYVAWVDADVFFREPHWAQETLHALQHFSIVQPWQQCADLGHHGNILDTHQSIGYLSQLGKLKPRGQSYPHGGHSGFAWAATRDFWEQVTGLMDFCILGSADHHMALACLGEDDLRVSGKVEQGFFRRCVEWKNRATKITHNQIGYVHGRIEHSFHGPKRRRYYADRWKILVDNNYNPDTDLMYDAQGMIQLVGKPNLEAAIRKYNRSRYEDSIEDE